jgi:formylglycine-generating enzyme required for sulfatase activity
MEFVLIPSGSFTMGSSTGAVAEKPPHEVKISQSYYLQTTQVTQGQWKEVMGDNPSQFNDCGEDCPVEKVSWSDAQQFIQKLNQKEGTDKHRLPTEAEWEYACRAGTTTEFSFGDEEGQLGEYAWFDENSQDKTHLAGTKKLNHWDLYDRHGNVWEWVEDDWHETYDEAPADERAWIIEPRGAAGRILRGGSWGNFARSCRAAARNINEADVRDGVLGFRLARSVALGP